MFFTVFIQQPASTFPQTTYTKSTVYPFPYAGRFRCRITGYQIKYGGGNASSSPTIAVISRAMVNPLSPYIFRVMPPGINSLITGLEFPDGGGFCSSGWWECDLSTGIDFALVSPEGAEIGNILVLLHFELERAVEGSLLMKP